MVNFALVGCGRIAPFHFEGIRESHGGIVRAVCDLDIKKAHHLVGEHKDIAVYDDYETMLSDPKIDVVNICTNHRSHFSLALGALNAGKHVVIEKPVTLKVADAEVLEKTAQEKQLKATVVFQNRFNPSITLTKSALVEGKFGTISHGTGSIRWCRDQAYYQQDPWRGKESDLDGILMNQSIHTLDLLMYLLGPIEKVTGQLKTAFLDIEMENIGLATLTFANGAIGLFEGAGTIFPTDLEGRISLFGETGTVILGGMAANEIETWRFKDQRVSDEEAIKQNLKKVARKSPSVYGFGHEKVMQDMIDAINDDRPPKVSLEDGKRALTVILAIYESAKKGGMPVYC